MKQKDVLFWVAIFGFFGITGLDIINGFSLFINDLYLKFGNVFWFLVIGGVYIYQNK